jgi:hypothetical protein
MATQIPILVPNLVDLQQAVVLAFCGGGQKWLLGGEKQWVGGRVDSSMMLGSCCCCRTCFERVDSVSCHGSLVSWWASWLSHYLFFKTLVSLFIKIKLCFWH